MAAPASRGEGYVQEPSEKVFFQPCSSGAIVKPAPLSSSQ